jgi:hypothetical protein
VSDVAEADADAADDGKAPRYKFTITWPRDAAEATSVDRGGLQSFDRSL